MKLEAGGILNKKTKGIILASFGGSMWGISGIFAQLLFSDYQASSEWLVSSRLLIAGSLILIYSALIKKENIFNVMKKSRDIVQLITFALVGMLGVQYFFFKSIELSNAAMATILQFTGPIFVLLYMLFRKEKSVNILEIFLVLITFLGVFLIVTNGNMSQMSISFVGLLVGIASAVAVAFYTLLPRKLLAEYGSAPVVGWGMLIAGIGFQFIHPIWKPGFSLDFKSIILLVGVILFGTALGFLAYLSSLNYIEASLASIMTALEPLLAAILSVVVLGQSFGFYEVVGIVLVLLSVLLLSNIEKIQKMILKESA